MGIFQSSTESTKGIKREEFINTYLGHILNHYKITKHLGIGSSGIVFLAHDLKTSLDRAIKEVRKFKLSADSSEQLCREIEVLKSLDHPNIMKIYEVIESPYAFYIVCELLKGECLMDKILLETYDHQNEAQIARHMDDILYAVSYCHHQGITHNDLNPGNLVFENTSDTAKLKLIDFGISSRFDRGGFSPIRRGEMYYRAPEVFKRMPEETCTQQFAERADMWSLGIIFYILLTGKSPVRGKTEKVVRGQVKKNGLDEYLFREVSASVEAVDLLRGMLEPDPERRITAAEALRHKWFQVYSSHTSENIDKALAMMGAFKVMDR